MKLSKNFDTDIDKMICCPCCGEFKADERLVYLVQKLRDMLMQPIVVTSGYRCEKYNSSKKIQGKKNSFHIQGLAWDITSPGLSSEVLYMFAEKITDPVYDGFQGIGYYPEEYFLHCDIGNRFQRWAADREYYYYFFPFPHRVKRVAKKKKPDVKRTNEVW